MPHDPRSPQPGPSTPSAEPGPPPAPRSTPGRWLALFTVVAVLAAAFAYVGGWLSPGRVSPAKVVDALQANGGTHPGYRRNHAKGICVTGYFEGSGAAVPYSSATLFTAVRTPVVGRFALPGGNPYAPDSGVPIRSFALRFTQADGQQWRTGMNAMPVFAVGTPEAFYEQALAGRPDPATGKPDPAKMKAFGAAHPETGPFMAWIKTAKPSSSYATETYHGLNAFQLVDAAGARHPVRWRVAPEAAAPAAPGGAPGTDTLDPELVARLAQGPQRWRLLLALGEPGDPTNDASKPWPDARKTVDAGTLVLESTQPQSSGACRDINYDPLVLPSGIEASDDPLLAARSAAYAESYLRRTHEEGEGRTEAAPATENATPGTAK